MNAVKPTALCIISLLLLLSSEFLSAAKCELAVVSPTEIQVTMRGSTALTNDQERQAALDNFRYEKYILGEHLPFVEITSPGASSGNGTPFASRLFIAWKNAEVANAAKEGINQLLPGACQPILNSEMARLKQRAKNEFNDHSLATTDTVLRIKTQKEAGLLLPKLKKISSFIRWIHVEKINSLAARRNFDNQLSKIDHNATVSMTLIVDASDHNNYVGTHEILFEKFGDLSESNIGRESNFKVHNQGGQNASTDPLRRFIVLSFVNNPQITNIIGSHIESYKGVSFE